MGGGEIEKEREGGRESEREKGLHRERNREKMREREIERAFPPNRQLLCIAEYLNHKAGYTLLMLTSNL